MWKLIISKIFCHHEWEELHNNFSYPGVSKYLYVCNKCGKTKIIEL